MRRRDGSSRASNMAYPGWSSAKQALLERRLKEAAAQPAALPVIGKRPDGNLAPLSSAQQQMMVIDQLAPGNPAYNLPTAFRLRGALDAIALEQSVNEVVKRHEILRTTFEISNDQPAQRIHGECRIDFK